MMAVSDNVKKKSRKLLIHEKVKKDMSSSRRLYFMVEGENDTYSVIFDREKGTWSCECKYSSMKGKECSHIHACKLYIKNKG